MLNNTTQHYLYFKQQVINEIISMIKLLKICVYVLIPFNVVEMIKNIYFPEYEFYLSLMFWVIVILLIFYWMPTKKEYRDWMKKNQSTF